MSDLISFLDTHWTSYLGCSADQIRDGRRHIIARPAVASQSDSPWPLRRGPICLFTTGAGWVMSVPAHLLDVAHSLCIGHTFGDLVIEGDRLGQAWFDRGARKQGPGSNRGDEGYRLMNRLAASYQLRGWSHYIHSYADSASRSWERDEHVRRITSDQTQLWAQWQKWPGPMVGPDRENEIADAFGYVLEGKLVSAAQLEASSQDFAWEYGVDTLPEFRGRGLATAVLRTITAFIIEQGRIPWHYCDHYNRPSRRLPEKLGYFCYGEGLFSAL